MKLTPVWLRDPLPLACSVRSVETNSISFCNKLGIIKRLFERELTFGFYLYDLRKPEFRDKGGYMHIKTKESTGIRRNGSDFWIISLWIGTNMEANVRFIYLLFCVQTNSFFFFLSKQGVCHVFKTSTSVLHDQKKSCVKSVVFFVMDGRYRISPEDSLGTLSVLCFLFLSKKSPEKPFVSNDKDYKFEH